MADPFLAEIRMMGFNFAPRGWATCDGQILPISQNSALFSLVGTFYGGDGRSTFGLPNLGGRVVIGHGQGPGLSPRVIGEVGGSDSITLTTGQMPAHSHTLMGTASPTQAAPTNALMSNTANGSAAYHAPTNPVAMAAGSVGTVGANLPIDNRPPELVLNFCIAMQGIYPPRP